MKENKYINQLFERYLEEFEKDDKYEDVSKKLENKYSEMEKKFSEENMSDIEEFEQYLTEIWEMEIKDAFSSGFRIAINLILDAKEEEKLK